MPPRSDIEAMDCTTILYIISWGVRNRQTFLRETAEHFRKDAIFHSEVDMPCNRPHRNAQFCMVVQSPYDIIGRKLDYLVYFNLYILLA